MRRFSTAISVFASVAFIAAVCAGQGNVDQSSDVVPKDDAVRLLAAQVEKLTTRVQAQNRIVSKLQAKIETQENDLKALRQIVVRQAVAQARQPHTTAVPGQLPSGTYDYRDMNLPSYFILCKDKPTVSPATLAPTQLRTTAPVRR